MTDKEIVNLIDKYIDLKTQVIKIQDRLDKVPMKQRKRVAKLIIKITGKKLI